MNFEYQKKNWDTFFWTCFWVALSLIFISGIVWLFCASASIDGKIKIVGCGDEHHWLYHFRWFKYFGLLGIHAIIIALNNYGKHLEAFRWENYKTVEMSFKHFKDTYLINTKRWSIDTDAGKLKYDLQSPDSWRHEWVQVCFSIPDWCKFNIYYWMRQRAKKIQKQEDEKKERNELLARIIKEMQKDVNKAFEELAVPDKTDPKSKTALEDSFYINDIRYMKVGDWEYTPGPPAYFKEAGTLTSNYDYYLLNDGITLLVYDPMGEKECTYKSYIRGTLDDGTKVRYDPTNKCYYEMMQSNAATVSPYNYYNSNAYNQVQKAVQDIANLKVKVSTIDNLMNTANQYTAGGGGGAGCIFTKKTQLDNRYSLYYTSDENKIYLYDNLAGTYNQIY